LLTLPPPLLHAAVKVAMPATSTMARTAILAVLREGLMKDKTVISSHSITRCRSRRGVDFADDPSVYAGWMPAESEVDW
jgi:hypothetical protein